MNPFSNPLCNANGAGFYSRGFGGQPAPDGFSQICAHSYCYQNGDPLTVWRSATYTPGFDSVYAYRMSPLSAPTKSVEVAYASQTNGTAVQQYTNWDGDPQKFNILASGSNWKITMKANNAKCLNPVAGATANGTQIEIRDCDGTTAQAWSVTADGNSGGFTFKSVKSGRCLNVTGASQSDGARMEIWDCSGGSNQKFKIQAY